jgi:sortase B
MDRNTDTTDNGIRYIDLSNSDDGIEIIDPDTVDTSDDIPASDPYAGQDTSQFSSDSAGNTRYTLIRRIIMCVSAVVFLFSVGMLICIFFNYHKADRIYNNVENTVFTPVQQASATSGETAADTDNTAMTQPADSVMAGFTYSHDALLKINSDSVGYLVLPALDLCLPIVQGSDNDYYLTHAITGEYSNNGTLFIDYRVEDGLEASNAIIYGHAMKNGSMFGSLYKLRNASLLTSGSNDTFYIYSGQNMYTYKIYSVHTTPAVSFTYTTAFADDASFLAYVEDMAGQSEVGASVPIAAGDKTITMSTCTNDDNVRLVVQAVRIAVTPLE